MAAGVLIGLALAFFLLVPIGIFADFFFVYGIGLTSAGIFLILFAIVVKNNWKGFHSFEGVRWLEAIFPRLVRLFLFALGVLMLTGASAFWQDVPLYLKKEYHYVEGVPSEIIYHEPTRGNIHPSITVNIEGQKLTIQPAPKYSLEELNKMTFKIFYLPNTEWLITYEII